ncbi:MAG: outer membrane beta-barrel protein [Bacteroidaceae bacterium]|nr:outer membrane beta-barrel protein [Bacteroidaceae bacterium]
MINYRRAVLALIMIFSLSGVMAQDWSSPETESMLRTYVKQVYEVNGKVYGVDEYEPNPYPLQGANILVTCMGDTTSSDGAAADKDGSFWTYMSRRDRLKDTRLRVRISYLGMQTLDSIIDPPMKRESGIHTYIVELDSVVLRSNPLTTEEVEIVAELQRMYQRGDTIIFNADAYEMPTGSVLLDLVRRLPGLKYSDGKMTYLGRDIEEIRLNGDSFFKRDMSIALNNMPTDKLKSLKVYEVPDDTLNVMSDNHLVMDMNTKEPMDRTIFTSVEVGTTEKFDKYRFAVDGSMWKQGGSEIYGSFSKNTIPYEYSTQLKTENSNGSLYYSKEFEKVSVSASAGYGSNYNENKTANYNKMFMPEFTQNSVSENTSSNGGHNWNGNVGLNGRIDDKTWYNLNMDMSRNWSNNSSSLVDSISNEGEGLISSTVQTSTGESTGSNYSVNGGLGKTFGQDDKYHLNLYLRVGRSDNDGSSTNISESRFAQLGDSVRKVNHNIYTPSHTNNYGANVSLNRQIGDYGYLGVGYNFSYDDGKSIQEYKDLETATMVDSLYYDKRNSNLNNAFDLDYFYTDSIYRINLSVNAAPVLMTIDNLNRMTDKDDEHIRYSGIRYSANANFRFKVFKKSQIGLGYNGSNGLPGVEQLSMVTDYSDPMNIRKGNSKLKNSFSHSVNLEFQLQSWMRTRVSYGTTINGITSLTRLDRQTGARITSPENINGSWNVSEYLFLTYPFQDLSVNFTANHSLRHNVAYVQSFTDAAANKSATDYNQVSLGLEGAYSDQFWMIRGDVGYTMDHSKSDYLEKASGGQRFNASAELSYQSSIGLGASTRCSYNRPFGYEMESANRPECLWSISAEWSFLKSRQATLSLTWRDILKSYNGFSASVSGTSWNESRTFGDTSMFVISFSYRFNNFR